MPRKRLNSYLQTYRLKAALTQTEFGALLGITADAVSKYERGLRPVSVKLLVGSAIVFGVSIAELFPAAWSATEREIVINAPVLSTRLAGHANGASKKKLALIANVQDRLRNVVLP